MSQIQSNDTARIDCQSFVWLAIAVLLLIFANGRWIIPIAAWLAPVFMLRFLRTGRTRRAMLLGYLAYFGAALINWSDQQRIRSSHHSWGRPLLVPADWMPAEQQGGSTAQVLTWRQA